MAQRHKGKKEKSAHEGAFFIGRPLPDTFLTSDVDSLFSQPVARRIHQVFANCPDALEVSAAGHLVSVFVHFSFGQSAHEKVIACSAR